MIFRLNVAIGGWRTLVKSTRATPRAFVVTWATLETICYAILLGGNGNLRSMHVVKSRLHSCLHLVSSGEHWLKQLLKSSLHSPVQRIAWFVSLHVSLKTAFTPTKAASIKTRILQKKCDSFLAGQK